MPLLLTRQAHASQGWGQAEARSQALPLGGGTSAESCQEAQAGTWTSTCQCHTRPAQEPRILTFPQQGLSPAGVPAPTRPHQNCGSTESLPCSSPGTALGPTWKDPAGETGFSNLACEWPGGGGSGSPSPLKESSPALGPCDNGDDRGVSCAGAMSDVRS